MRELPGNYLEERPDANDQVCPKCNYIKSARLRARDCCLTRGIPTQILKPDPDPLLSIASPGAEIRGAALHESERRRERSGKLGYSTLISAMEYEFIGGSMGSVVEMITRSSKSGERENAFDRGVGVGGACMHEGALLMQMGKVSGAPGPPGRRAAFHLGSTNPTTVVNSRSRLRPTSTRRTRSRTCLLVQGSSSNHTTKLPMGFQRPSFLWSTGC